MSIARLPPAHGVVPPSMLRSPWCRQSKHAAPMHFKLTKWIWTLRSHEMLVLALQPQEVFHMPSFSRSKLTKCSASYYRMLRLTTHESSQPKRSTWTPLKKKVPISHPFRNAMQLSFRSDWGRKHSCLSQASLWHFARGRIFQACKLHARVLWVQKQTKKLGHRFTTLFLRHLFLSFDFCVAE